MLCIPIQFQAFLKAIQEGGIDLEETEEVKPDYEPGINYDDTWEVENLKARQFEAKIPTTAKWATKKSNTI